MPCQLILVINSFTWAIRFDNNVRRENTCAKAINYAKLNGNKKITLDWNINQNAFAFTKTNQRTFSNIKHSKSNTELFNCAVT